MKWNLESPLTLRNNKKKKKHEKGARVLDDDTHIFEWENKGLVVIEWRRKAVEEADIYERSNGKLLLIWLQVIVTETIICEMASVYDDLCKNLILMSSEELNRTSETLHSGSVLGQDWFEKFKCRIGIYCAVQHNVITSSDTKPDEASFFKDCRALAYHRKTGPVLKKKCWDGCHYGQDDVATKIKIMKDRLTLAFYRNSA